MQGRTYTLVAGKTRQARDRYLEGMDYPELAERYGVSAATMRKRVSRALRNVREAYLAMEQFARGGK